MKPTAQSVLPKTRSGIDGLDEITNGGLPQGRPTLICGGAGCGKTLFGIQFLVQGITQYKEPGVFISFEESRHDLMQNVTSLGFELEKHVQAKKLYIDQVKVERSEIEETGEYDLEALFIRINYAIDKVKAKRVVLDTIESLFGGIENETLLRSELRRLFHWLKTKGVTTVITGERGEKSLTRQGLEEYVSDCVILLDFRVIDQIATRRLRIVKYRGSTHGTNEYPFLIDEQGISVLPITSLKLNHAVSSDIISTGLKGIDDLFYRGGFFRGSSILVTGSAGTAKTIIASYFALASCQRKERTLYFSFEESPEQLLRNLKSIGINFNPFLKSGLMSIHSSRPSLQGLEMHLLVMFKLIDEVKPKTVVIDPISNLLSIGTIAEVRDMLVRVIDFLKARKITALFTSLTHPNSPNYRDLTVDAVSSLSDIWIDVQNESFDGDYVRKLRMIKTRGMGHRTDMQEFTITDKGIKFTTPTTTQ
jgi:circadian clock protein KaiC